MKHFKSIILLLVAFLLVPVQHIHAEEAESKELDIPEIVLEHLADAYEWHIASYEGKHLSVPLPIIVRSENTGEWHFCTAHTRLTVCPMASSSVKSIMARSMSV